MEKLSIRLPADLLARAKKAVKGSNQSLNLFLRDALLEKIALAESRTVFSMEADRRFEQIVAGGETVPWDVVKRRLARRVFRAVKKG